MPGAGTASLMIASATSLASLTRPGFASHCAASLSKSFRSSSFMDPPCRPAFAIIRHNKDSGNELPERLPELADVERPRHVTARAAERGPLPVAALSPRGNGHARRGPLELLPHCGDQ